MKFNAWENGKGPWGSPNGSPKKPTGNKPTANRRPQQGAQNRPQQPELEDLLRQMQEKIQRLGNGGGGKGGSAGGNNFNPVPYMLGAALLFWLASGFYIVKPDQEGVVTRFGAYSRTTTEGLHYHLPSPIEAVVKPQVTRENITSIGFRGNAPSSFRQPMNNNNVRDVPAESLMLTGDENILDLDFSVRWKIANARDYLYNVKDVEGTIKNVAESAMREVIGSRPIDDALTGNKQEVQDAAQSLIQSVLDEYGAGVLITGVELQEVNPPTAVIDAFRDIQAARADAERAVSEAKGYANDIIPRARGEVAQIMQNAEAYKGAKVAEATGAAMRFESQLTEYRKARDVTKKRLYLETMQKVLSGANKVVVTGDAGQGIVPYLPLNELKKKAQ